MIIICSSHLRASSFIEKIFRLISNNFPRADKMNAEEFGNFFFRNSNHAGFNMKINPSKLPSYRLAYSGEIKIA